MLSTNTKSQSNTRVRRKNIKFSFLISLIILSLISCEEEELNRESSCNENEAIFTSTIRSFIIEFAKTRATGTNWDKQDAIGIYAIEAEQELNEESIYNGYSNIKYINTTSGEVANYSAADSKILLPVNNQTFNFISYYPYTSNITEFTIPIDITVQEPREDINIMYATSKGHTWDNSNVEFEFQRVLSSIVIHLSSKEGIELQDATIIIENASTNATFNLADGEVSVGQEKNAIIPKIEYDIDKNELITIATLMPGQDLSDLEIQIQLANGNNYTWTPDQYILPSQVTRCYEFNLTYDDVELTSSGSTIKDWEYDRDDTVHVLKPVPKDNTEDPEDSTDPEEEGGSKDPEDSEDLEEGEGSDDPTNPEYPEELGNGTKDNPYTVDQAIAAQDEAAWVEGFLVGYGVRTYPGFKLVSDDFDAENASYNIILANDILENDEKLMIPIELNRADQSIINSLNLKDNEYLLYYKVKIYCDLRSYLDVPGGKFITDYELLPNE